jgi:hypothetical protein
LLVTDRVVLVVLPVTVKFPATEELVAKRLVMLPFTALNELAVTLPVTVRFPPT